MNKAFFIFMLINLFCIKQYIAAKNQFQMGIGAKKSSPLNFGLGNKGGMFGQKDDDLDPNDPYAPSVKQESRLNFVPITKLPQTNFKANNQSKQFNQNVNFEYGDEPEPNTIVLNGEEAEDIRIVQEFLNNKIGRLTTYEDMVEEARNDSSPYDNSENSAFDGSYSNKSDNPVEQQTENTPIKILAAKLEKRYNYNIHLENCALMRNIKEGIPSVKMSKFQKFKNFFKKSPIENGIKSYRSVLFAFLSELQTEKILALSIKQLLEENNILKKNYFKEFYVTWAQPSVLESHEQEQILETIPQLESEIQEIEQEIKDNQKLLNQEKKELNIMAKTLRNSQIKVVLTQYNLLSDIQRDVRTSNEKISEANLELVSSDYIDLDKINEYNKLIELKQKSDSALDITKYQLEMKKKNPSLYKNQDLDNFNESLEILEQINSVIKESIEEYVDTLDDLIEDPIRELWDSLATMKIFQGQHGDESTYETYREKIYKAIEISEHLKELLFTFHTKGLELQKLKLKTQNVNYSDPANLIIPETFVIGLEIKLKNMVEFHKNFTENSNFFVEVEEKYKLQKEEKFQNFLFNYNNLFVSNIRIASKMLNAAKNIQISEGKLDFLLGYFVGKIQKFKHAKKTCFTLSNLSHFVFLMIKHNIISQDQTFFQGLFSTMDQNEKNDFIVFNYTVFASTDFVKALLDNHNKQLALSEQNKPIVEAKFTEDFITNFSLFLSIFKDRTEYGNGISLKEKAKLYAKRFLKFLKIILKTALKIGTHISLNLISKELTRIVLIHSSFIRGIPGAKYILMILFRIVLEVLKILTVKLFSLGYKALGSAITEHQRYLKFNENTKIYDYEKDIQNQIDIYEKNGNPEFEGKDFKDINDVEKAFVNCAKSTKSIFNKLEKLGRIKIPLDNNPYEENQVSNKSFYIDRILI